MTASHRSDPVAPRLRSDGPPGIDWTEAAPDCPACWRARLSADLPSGTLLSRRTHAALAAVTLAPLFDRPRLSCSHPSLTGPQPRGPA